MIKQDKFDEQVERLLPCQWYDNDCYYAKDHAKGCPAYYRPAVSAALRELGEKNEKLKHEFQQAKDAVAHLEQGKPLGELVGKQTIVNMSRELADLRADRDRWKENFESSPVVQQAVKRFHMQIENNSKSWYEPSQMRLLERLANQIGNEGTLFHEISSMFKDSNHQIANLRAEIERLNQHDENCDTRDTMIPGKPCNCYAILDAKLKDIVNAWDLAINPVEMGRRSATISQAGWSAMQKELGK